MQHPCICKTCLPRCDSLKKIVAILELYELGDVKMNNNEFLYKWYKDLKTKYDDIPLEIYDDIEMIDMLREWKRTLEDLEKSHPQVKIQYEKDLKIQDSFSQEQIDFICYQIGCWYLEWKNKISPNNEHNLGFAKENLKTMICG